MKKKLYITPTIKEERQARFLQIICQSPTITSDPENRPQSTGWNLGNGTSNYANDRGFGSTYADEISTSGSIWDF